MVAFYGRSKGPIGGKYAPRNRMIDMLIAQGANTSPVQSHTEGIARALTGGLGGFMARQALDKDEARETKYGADMAKIIAGAQAKPWVNPDTQTPMVARGEHMPPPDATEAEIQALMAATGRSREAVLDQPPPGPMVSTGPAGGLPGALSAFSKIDNPGPDLAQFGQQLGMADIQQKQEAALAAQEAAAAKAAADLEHERSLEKKAAPGWAPPRSPRTVTTADGVYVLNPDGSRGERLGAPKDSSGVVVNNMPGASGPQIGRIPPGYEARLVDGAYRMLPIEGGPADRKINEAGNKAQSALVSLEQQTGVVTSTIDRALGNISAWTTGYGAYLSGLPNTDARALENDLNTIKANVGFDKLQSMRDNSPTGGALGQVSEFENKLLQAVNGALDPLQRDQLAANLKRIRDLYPAVLAERKKAFQLDYGDIMGEQSPPTDKPQEMHFDADGNFVQ